MGVEATDPEIGSDPEIGQKWVEPMWSDFGTPYVGPTYNEPHHYTFIFIRQKRQHSMKLKRNNNYEKKRKKHIGYHNSDTSHELKRALKL